MRATDVLRNNHKAILVLLERCRHGGNHRRRDLFSRIKRAVRTHLCLEEEMLYPAMHRRPSPNADRNLDPLFQEHIVLDDQLRILSGMGTQHRDFNARLGSLSWRMKEHLVLEQNGPYREIQRVLKREDQEKLGAQISARLELLSRAALLSA
jgi:hemerythrin-like domain-containing protein